MENKARYTIVGLFLILFTICLTVFLLWQARYSINDTKIVEYRVYTKESVSGLNVNSFVLYKGLDIGFVESLQIDPKNNEQIQIKLKITNPDVIKTDSYAIIQSQGITGNKSVEISGGSKDAKVLKPLENDYAVIPLKTSFMDQITNDAKNITQKVNSALVKTNKLLNDQNLKNIEKLIGNLTKTSHNFNELITSMNSVVNNNLQKNLKSIESLTVRLDSVFEKSVPKTLDGIDQFTANWSNLSIELNSFLQKDLKNLTKNLNSSIEGTNNIEQTVNHLQNTMEQIENTLDGFNENGGNMIFNTRDIKYGPGENR